MTKEEEKYTTLDTEQCKWWVNHLFNIAKEKACNSHNFDDGEEIQAAQDKIIKALEQQSITCNANTNDIAQSFKADVEAVIDYLLNGNSMEFPHTFDEFANDYGFTDDKEIYTNGSHLIPVFRVKQWLNHIKRQPSDDCVSREELLKAMYTWDKFGNDPNKGLIPLRTPALQDRYVPYVKYEDMVNCVKNKPPVSPTHGMCKDCTKSKILNNFEGNSIVCSRFGRMHVNPDFYCADFERQGKETSYE